LSVVSKVRPKKRFDNFFAILWASGNWENPFSKFKLKVLVEPTRNHMNFIIYSCLKTVFEQLLHRNIFSKIDFWPPRAIFHQFRVLFWASNHVFELTNFQNLKNSWTKAFFYKIWQVHIDLKRKFQSRIFRLQIVGRQSRCDHVHGSCPVKLRKMQYLKNAKF
jgi:hypothetical protein